MNTTLNLNCSKSRVKVLKPAIERFLSKISISDNGCWEWTASKTRGYGQFRLGVKMLKSHRFIYEYYHGEINSNLTIDHLCRNTICCHPKHLEEVTTQENILRGMVGHRNKNKTHCKQGHEYTKENTYFRSDGWRNCRICNRLSHKKKVVKEA